jgi:hypothetical protein
LPAVDATFTITPLPRSFIPGAHGADRADIAHDVQLPELVPLLVGHLFERALVCEADVVDEHVDSAEPLFDLADEALRFAELCEIGCDMQRLADLRRPVAPARGDDRRAFRREQPCSFETMPPVEPVTMHTASCSPRSRGTTLAVDGTLISRTSWRDRLERGGPAPGGTPTGRSTTTAETQAKRLADQLAGTAF